MTSVPVLEKELAFLNAAEAILKNLHGLPPAFQAIDKAVEAIIQQEINTIESELPCYLRGTMIETASGEVAVENLNVGDFVVTASGENRRVVWIGHRRFDLNSHPHPQPQKIYPILVRAHAFGNNQPKRDLWLSPAHNVRFDGYLIPIRSLINEVSIVCQPRMLFEYWHVELEQHDIMLAEGLPAESYLDTGNRMGFANGGDFIEAHPDFEARHWSETCLPMIVEGPAVVSAKAHLLKRLAERGFQVTQEADAHVIVDGRRIGPIHIGPKRLEFTLPAGGNKIELRSRMFIPAHTTAESSDVRSLGLCVSALMIDGAPLSLDDDESCAWGWQNAEIGEDGGFTHRWTTGSTPLPANARIVTIDLSGFGSYWAEPEEKAVALTA